MKGSQFSESASATDAVPGHLGEDVHLNTWAAVAGMTFWNSINWLDNVTKPMATSCCVNEQMQFVGPDSTMKSNGKAFSKYLIRKISELFRLVVF